ncbi:MAG: AbrB/MazE/SpoVT family DNA-binding domain-containing protein [Olsenella sp.]|jgi:antitoxin PrlF|nr:AbrB/MazE/SpoVT family DNA-binding domain-containing protein [Olsenella sp.]
MQTTFADNAKVMSKGQVTIPKEVREVLGVQSGDKVTFIVDGSTVRVVNAAVYAMRLLQEDMAGEAERAGIMSEEDADAVIAQMRREG